MKKVTAVIGMSRARPPMVFTSWLSFMAWMTEPAPRKSRAL